jgi:hypothetical protein
VNHKPNSDKNIKIIKWLTSLAPAKQVVAILLIAVVTLFTPLSFMFYKNVKAVDKCNTEKIELVERYNIQIQNIKDKQIEKLELEKERTISLDSALKATDRIIQKKINQVK